MVEETPDPPQIEPAALHLEAMLAPRGGSGWAKALRSAATLAAGLAGDLEAGPSETDLVVVRRSNGREILRVSAGSVAEADRLLQQVRRDLSTKTVAEFVGEWRAE